LLHIGLDFASLPYAIYQETCDYVARPHHMYRGRSKLHQTLGRWALQREGKGAKNR